jgi:general secretion pathway protein E/type IV pilus assembly protein PilB
MQEYKAVSLDFYPEIPVGEEQYSFEFIETNGAIVLEAANDHVTIGITDKSGTDALTTLRGFHGQPARFVKIQQDELASWLGRKLGGNIDARNEKDRASPHSAGTLFLDKLANDAPVVNLINSICIDAIRQGASDIHLEAGASCIKVRYRIDGILQKKMELENERFAAISSRIKIMANLNILEKRQPQDGRITVSIGKKTVDLRVSIIPVVGGESIVMRILGKSERPLNLPDLGFSPIQLKDIRSMLKIPHGLILVTGPTGSGKTTTLNAMMKELVSDEIKIVSIEDPVEFLVDGVNQIQINEQISLGFDTILRRVLRHDPNVIMVGEIRDKATAEISVRAALTGHLVLSTLHTNDAISVIPRLINMGIEPYLIASVLKGAIAQRLVRKCASQNSCESGKTKYEGRTVISETFTMDQELEEIILHGAAQADMISHLVAKETVFMEEDAKEKIAAGLTTQEEAEREISFTNGGPA